MRRQICETQNEYLAAAAEGKTFKDVSGTASRQCSKKERPPFCGVQVPCDGRACTHARRVLMAEHSSPCQSTRSNCGFLQI